jgi:hypothetical protein
VIAGDPVEPLQEQSLLDAERLFKLALAVHAACTSAEGNAFRYLEAFSFRRHLADHQQLALTPGEEKRAAAAFEHRATHLLAVQIDTALQRVVPNRFRHHDDTVRSAAWVARLVRNAFAHDPLRPRWKTYAECDSAVYEVPGVIVLRTAGLNGKRVRRMDYGGPPALLALSTFVRSTVLRSRER